MLGGFLSLSARTRDVLWYSMVDEDRDTAVATFAGLAPHTVPTLRETARGALREAWPRTHLERGGEQTCQGFRGLVETVRCGRTTPGAATTWTAICPAARRAPGCTAT
ncbi:MULTISPECIES: hypothetical protein [Streptomyces]|uniref:hypothetical protein n=1 Tax=Streptomyces TaxID=1883 RepID=UPI000F7A689F|nr:MULTISPECIES: hypothetical protein [unclassified Streptomyces]AJZ87020.1 hypothetical protein AS97_21650 [Streptomyces sp. AgN23]RSS36617.1 hypothetical protein EF902_34835 [Streptomyces sp. WAC05858]